MDDVIICSLAGAALAIIFAWILGNPRCPRCGCRAWNKDRWSAYWECNLCGCEYDTITKTTRVSEAYRVSVNYDYKDGQWRMVSYSCNDAKTGKCVESHNSEAERTARKNKTNN